MAYFWSVVLAKARGIYECLFVDGDRFGVSLMGFWRSGKSALNIFSTELENSSGHGPTMGLNEQRISKIR